MRILFHTPISPFGRRARLALAHKGLPFELRDVRADPKHMEEVRRLSPLKTVPVLVEENGQVLGDSTAISHYLDRVYPSATPLWPAGPEDALRVFDVASLVDVALNTIVDMGRRYYALNDSPAWGGVQDEMIGRAQRALDALGERVSSLSQPTVARSGWSAADMWLVTAENFLAHDLPKRAQTNAPFAAVIALGWRFPAALSRWVDQHRDRPEVRALG